MLDRFKKKGRLTAIGLLLLAQGLTHTVQAQTPETVLRGVFDSVVQGRNRDKSPQQSATPMSKDVTAADMLGTSAATPATEQAVLYPTRKRLLKAARMGEFAGLNRASAQDRKKVVASVQHILMVEYKVPPISQNCYENGFFASDVATLLGDLTEVQVITLSDKPPEFTNTNVNLDNLTNNINKRLSNLQSPRDRTHCDDVVMGKIVPHPYKAALVSLAGNFAKATQAYVDGERIRRQSEYQQAVTQQQEQDRQRQTKTAAAEQQRIDAEADRIRLQEQSRAKKEKARVGG